jgi:ubiquinone/menaquinone biosynthesis C-methylase UbiE
MNYPHHSILEIGAGEGSILQKLRELNYAQALYALEISESGIEAIQKRNIPDLIECKLYDGYEVPYSDKRFDLAILSHVLEICLC